MMVELVGATALLAGGILGAAAWQVRRRNMQRWLPTYLAQWSRFRAPAPGEDIHVILCFADHYEPKAAGADVPTGARRVAAWTERFPQQFARFRDSDGVAPRYTFFFPVEEYEKQYLDALAGLCRAGFGEVEIHLHHDNDTADGLRAKLQGFKETLFSTHGLLARHRDTHEIMYGFIHGNWALCNARPDRRWCGVNNEIEVLLATGCYADFTFPSAPHETQPGIINRIYYACDRPGQPCSHEHEIPLQTPRPANALLMVQGPLLPDWNCRKWGVVPTIENGCLQSSQLPSLSRLRTWLKARVQVPARPDWFFVKLHAHGASEHEHESLLGAPMVKFHEDLARLSQENPRFHFHYVTAREMVNLIHAAAAGYQGDIAGARDWMLLSNVQR